MTVSITVHCIVLNRALLMLYLRFSAIPHTNGHMIRFGDIDILTRMNSVIDTIIILYIGANQFVYVRRTHNRHNIRSNDNEEHSPVESHTHAGLDWWTKCATAGSGLGQAPCVHYIILLVVAQQSDHAEILPTATGTADGDTNHSQL